jgi:serine protease DegS
MPAHKLFSFLLKSITVGLAAAFVIVFLRPDLLDRQRPIVEVRQSASPFASTARFAENGEFYPLSGPASYAGAVELASPAVVNIFTSKTVTQRSHPLLDDPFFQHFFGERAPALPRKRMETSLGSGVIVSPQGYVLTNHHVIEGADEIQVALYDGRGADARIVGIDPETDLAVLRVTLSDLPAITIGDSESLRVGDVALAIGNPFGVGQTVTMGIVSATGRKQLGINTFENFIQTDAAINPGNSGGALINPHGELIGINTAIFSRTGGSQGIGFAIPVSLARDVMQQIIEHGRVIRGWLGIEAQEITPALAESFGLQEVKGVLVAGVLRNSPADRSGLRPGDIIISIQGAPVNDTAAVLNLIAQHPPGTRIEVVGLRNGRPLSVTATIAQRPSQRPG